MLSSRTSGIQYSVLETHNTTWQTTVTVVEHYGNFYITTEYFLLNCVPCTLLTSYMYYYMCALHCYVCQDQHLLTNLQETSSVILRRAILL